MLFGKGGLVERLLLFIPVVTVCNSVSDTDVVIPAATSGMLAVEGDAVVAATAKSHSTAHHWAEPSRVRCKPF